jgi:tRNA A37 threonylcarbamoyladenosine dehydratase
MSEQTHEPHHDAPSDDYYQRFSGIGRLYGRRALLRLHASHIAVVGVGGVGCWAAEALARSGIGSLTLIDLDEVCINNTNRQSHALDGQIGRLKIEALGDRIRLINPSIKLTLIDDFFTQSSADQLLSTRYDVVLDAIDDLYNKALLIASCRERGLPIITVGGAGGRRDPTQLQVTDLSQSGQDGLLRKLRKRLRDHHNFPDASAPEWGIPCIGSRERPVYPLPDGEVCEQPTDAKAARLDCSSGFGACTQVTGAFGFAAASLAINLLIAPQ